MANKATIVYLKRRVFTSHLRCGIKAERMYYDPYRTTLEQRMKNLRVRSGDQTKRCLEL